MSSGQRKQLHFFSLPFLKGNFSFLKGTNFFPLSIEFKGKNLLLEGKNFPIRVDHILERALPGK